MAEAIDYELSINGEQESVRLPAHITLLEALRSHLHLTGTKSGCNQGVCGACTVLLDGKPARACLALAADCTGRTITTIEGIAPQGSLSAVQRAMVECGAIQCGFCTPGMVLTLEALFRDNPKPERDEIREGLSGNLCRCSGYVKIMDAAMKIAAGEMA